MSIKQILKEHKITSDVYRKLSLMRRYIYIKYFFTGTIKRDFYNRLGYELNLKNPQTFNEKLQWLKANYRNPKMKPYADKYEVRKIIKEKLGEEYLNDLYGVYDSVEDINFEDLPQKFVLKPTHSSGHVILCLDKQRMNWKKEKRKLKRWLKENYYYEGGEWVYKDIQPRIICEKLLEENIIDYKIYCFNGKPLFTQVISNRKGSAYNANYYDLEWNPIEIKRKDITKSSNEIKKPLNYDVMIKFSKEISKEFPFVRMDFYEVNSKLYFGEATFFPVNGFIKFETREEDEKWGEYLQLQ